MEFPVIRPSNLICCLVKYLHWLKGSSSCRVNTKLTIRNICTWMTFTGHSNISKYLCGSVRTNANRISKHTTLFLPVATRQDKLCEDDEAPVNQQMQLAKISRNEINSRPVGIYLISRDFTSLSIYCTLVSLKFYHWNQFQSSFLRVITSD